jgi:hypothetical protein
VCSHFTVWVNRVGKERIDALIRMYRGPKTAVELRFQILWAGIVETGGTFNIGQPVNP